MSKEYKLGQKVMVKLTQAAADYYGKDLVPSCLNMPVLATVKDMVGPDILVTITGTQITALGGIDWYAGHDYRFANMGLRDAMFEILETPIAKWDGTLSIH